MNYHDMILNALEAGPATLEQIQARTIDAYGVKVEYGEVRNLVQTGKIVSERSDRYTRVYMLPKHKMGT